MTTVDHGYQKSGRDTALRNRLRRIEGQVRGLEKMIDEDPDSPHTAHTVGDVPLVVFDDRFRGRTMQDGATLADIGPTMLAIMGLEQPEEMTGRNLLQE